MSVRPLTQDDFPCERCGHSPEWHRLDDALNIDPSDPAAEFRCLGKDFTGCAQSCPDFVAPEGYDDWIERMAEQ